MLYMRPWYRYVPGTCAALLCWFRPFVAAMLKTKMIQQGVRYWFAIMLACVTAYGANDAARPANFRSDANVVLVGATVLGSHNRVVRGLTQTDFRLFENATEQRIVSFGEVDLPVSMAILFDTSGSMEGQLPNARAALAALLETSNHDDEFSLVTFADQPRIAVPWNRSPGDIAGQVLFNKSSGRTALLDAVQMGVEQLRQSHNPRRALVIFSDGGDNFSRLSERRLVRLIEEADVQVYAVDMQTHGNPGMDRADEEVAGPSLLAELCEHGSGRYFAPEGQRSIERAADQIGKELRSQYLLGYAPSEPTRDGKFHRVQLKVLRPAGSQRVSVYFRRGYRAPAN